MLSHTTRQRVFTHKTLSRLFRTRADISAAWPFCCKGTLTYLYKTAPKSSIFTFNSQFTAVVTLCLAHTDRGTARFLHTVKHGKAETAFCKALSLRRREVSRCLCWHSSSAWRATHDGSNGRKRCCCVPLLKRKSVSRTVDNFNTPETHFKLRSRLNNYSN